MVTTVGKQFIDKNKNKLLIIIIIYWQDKELDFANLICKSLRSLHIKRKVDVSKCYAKRLRMSSKNCSLAQNSARILLLPQMTY